MAIAVTDLGNNISTSGATLTLALTSIPAGAAIILGAGEYNTQNVGTLSDGTNGAYTNAKTQSNAGAPSVLNLFYFLNSAGFTGTATFTKGLSGSNATIQGIYATGILTAAALDAAVTAGSSSSAANPPLINFASGTPGVSGELFVGISGGQSNGTVRTWTPDTGNGWDTPPPFAMFQSQANSNSAHWQAGGYQVNAGSGAITYNPTLNSGNGNRTADSIIVGFKSASGSITDKSVAVTNSKQVSVVRSTKKIVTVTQTAAVVILKSIFKIISVVRASTVVVHRSVNHIVTLIQQSSLVSALKTVVKKVAASKGLSVTIVTLKTLLKTVAVTQTKTVSVLRSITKFIAVSKGSIVTVRRVMTLARTTIAVAQAKIVTVLKKVNKFVVVTQAKTAIVSAIKQFIKIVAVTQTKTVLVKRVQGKLIRVLKTLVADISAPLRPSALLHWPANIPFEALTEGYSEASEDNVTEFTPETGPPKLSRKASTSAQTLTFGIRMTTAEVALFNTWFRETLSDGTQPFTASHPRTGVHTKWRFMATPKYRDFSYGNWRVDIVIKRSR